MKLLVMLVLALAVSGCATNRAAGPETIKTVEVLKKVKEPCISKAPVKPARKTGKGAYPGDAAAASTLASDLERAEQYGAQWEAAAAGCVAQ